MAKRRIYKCCICHEKITEYMPIRLTQQKYGAGNYKQYTPIKNFDFCKKCFYIFYKWIEKHSDE